MHLGLGLLVALLKHATHVHTDTRGVHVAVGPFSGSLSWNTLEREVVSHVPPHLWNQAFPVIHEVGRRFQGYKPGPQTAGPTPNTPGTPSSS